MAHVQFATPPTSPRDLSSHAYESNKPIAGNAKLGDFNKFCTLGDRGVSDASTACDGFFDRRISTFSDTSSLDERDGLDVQLQKDLIVSIAQRVVKNSAHAASLMDPTDPDERLLAVSESLQEITGYSEAELLQSSPRLLTEGCEYEIDPEVQNAVRSAHLAGGPLLARAVHRNKGGWLFRSTMCVQGLMVGVDPVTDEPVWLKLTTYSRSDEDEDEEDEAADSGGAFRQLQGAGEALRAAICAELALCAEVGACRPAEGAAGTPLGCAGVLLSRWAGLGFAGLGWPSLGGSCGGELLTLQGTRGC